MNENVKAIGIGESHVTAKREEIIKAFSLDSCLAVIVYDKAGIGGMVHIALPDSASDDDCDHKPEAYYADLALPRLLQRLQSLGASLPHAMLKLAGGADSRYAGDRFAIGRRNILAVKRYLWSRGLGVVAEDTGGVISRTVELWMADGSVTIRSNGACWNL